MYFLVKLVGEWLNYNLLFYEQTGEEKVKIERAQTHLAPIWSLAWNPSRWVVAADKKEKRGMLTNLSPFFFFGGGGGQYVYVGALGSTRCPD